MPKKLDQVAVAVEISPDLQHIVLCFDDQRIGLRIPDALNLVDAIYRAGDRIEKERGRRAAMATRASVN
jgi:hypothetical protein